MTNGLGGIQGAVNTGIGLAATGAMAGIGIGMMQGVAKMAKTKGRRIKVYKAKGRKKVMGLNKNMHPIVKNILG